MNNTKQQLINKVQETMAKNGVSAPSEKHKMPGVETFIQSLQWLPEENLQIMADCDISGCKSFQEAYQAYGRAGAFKFTPYLVDAKYSSNPCLCIRRNRFMHMFRGHYFQVSETVTGIIDHENGAYRTTFLTKVPYGNEMLRTGLISYMLWWAAFISVGFCFDNFRELFDANTLVLEEYLQKCMEHYHVARDQHWEDLKKYIVWSNERIDPARTIYQLSGKDRNGSDAYLAVGTKSVQVELPNVLLTINIPDLSEGVGRDPDDEDELMEHEYEVYTLEHNHYLEMITVMAIALCGFKISFINWYPLEEHTGMLPKTDYPVVESLNDIYDCVPDEF